MAWYFLEEDRKQTGPISDADFKSLVEAGKIRDDTLVWQEGMADWQPYSAVAGPAPIPTERPAETASPDKLNLKRPAGRCRECGRHFPPEDLVTISGRQICADCKPIVLQKMREGLHQTGEFEYGGFWIRAVAKILDGLILGVVNFLMGAAADFMIGIMQAAGGTGGTVSIGLGLIQTAIGAAYTTFFIGRFGATPGKMACGLRVIRPDGDNVSYLRAFARHFAEWLSGIILFIGYLMAAFDREKRALHDHICDTRVIHSK